MPLDSFEESGNPSDAFGIPETLLTTRRHPANWNPSGNPGIWSGTLRVRSGNPL